MDNTASIEAPNINNHPILTFHLNQRGYSVPINQVIQIINLVEITPLPLDIPAIQGVINFRGQIVPVVDLRLRFGMPSQTYTLDTPLIIVQNQAYLLAMVVDQVDHVQTVASTDFLDARQLGKLVGENHPSQSILGVIKLDQTLIPILNVETLLTDSEHEILAKTLQTRLED